MFRQRFLSSSQVGSWMSRPTIAIPSSTLALSGYTSQTPAGTGDFSGGYELGYPVTFNAPGRLSGLRYYRHGAQASTSHNLRVWNIGGALLSTAVTSGESGAGWVDGRLNADVDVGSGGISMIISIESTVTDHVFACTNPKGADIINPPITLYTSGPRYASPGQMPSAGTPTAASVWLDVLFSPTP